eukprot:4013336-Amphidinium_carterae.1
MEAHLLDAPLVAVLDGLRVHFALHCRGVSLDMATMAGYEKLLGEVPCPPSARLWCFGLKVWSLSLDHLQSAD